MCKLYFSMRMLSLCLFVLKMFITIMVGMKILKFNYTKSIV